MTTSFPPGFFDRADEAPDPDFYAPPRLVTHIDAAAIAALGEHYRRLGVTGDVLDLMSSWVSHLPDRPRHLSVLGMNAAELAANEAAHLRVVGDLNATPALPFADAVFDDVLCCVSIDYLTRPVEVLADVARVLRPGGRAIVSISNRCFPTKAIRGWLATDDRGHVEIVRAYLAATGRFGPATVTPLTPPPGVRGDLLVALHAAVLTG